jgi:hypothetical protein
MASAAKLIVLLFGAALAVMQAQEINSIPAGFETNGECHSFEGLGT